MLLVIFDPEGVARRKARRMKRRVCQNKVRDPWPLCWPSTKRLGEFCSTQGQDFEWYIDGYYKLKPYGFPIHSCIYGSMKYYMIFLLRM